MQCVFDRATFKQKFRSIDRAGPIPVRCSNVATGVGKKSLLKTSALAVPWIKIVPFDRCTDDARDDDALHLVRLLIWAFS
jgi:hypothetical protein